MQLSNLYSNRIVSLINKGYRVMLKGITYFKDVVPMLYLKNQNPRNLYDCKGFRFINVVLEGVEPPTS